VASTASATSASWTDLASSNRDSNRVPVLFDSLTAQSRHRSYSTSDPSRLSLHQRSISDPSDIHPSQIPIIFYWPCRSGATNHKILFERDIACYLSHFHGNSSKALKPRRPKPLPYKQNPKKALHERRCSHGSWTQRPRSQIKIAAVSRRRLLGIQTRNSTCVSVKHRTRWARCKPSVLLFSSSYQQLASRLVLVHDLVAGKEL
jgi:hypothetical protein